MRVYDEFFRLSISEQQQLIQTYPLDKQVDIYLATRHYVHPHAYHLAHVIAKNGESILPELTYRLAHASNDDDKLDLLWVFPLLEAEGGYAVADNVVLMALLNREVQSIESKAAKESAMNSLQRIRRSGTGSRE